MEAPILPNENDIKLIVEQTVKQVLCSGSLLPVYMNTAFAATYLGLSKQRLEIWRIEGVGPQYIKLAQAVRYKRSDLDAFMASHLRNHTSEVLADKNVNGGGKNE